jgi:hypothetical protein
LTMRVKKNIDTIISTISLLIILASLIIYSQNTISPDIQVNFKVPKDWKKLNDTLFIIRNFNKELNYWETNLGQGHMPWRFDPTSIAVTCLWKFGITDSTPVFIFANRLTEIKRDEIYSLTVDSTNYFIYVRTRRKIPVAYKLKIKYNSKKFGF